MDAYCIKMQAVFAVADDVRDLPELRDMECIPEPLTYVYSP